MTSQPVPMVSSSAACGVKAAHVLGKTRIPRMSKAREGAQAPLGDASRLSWPDVAYRQSEVREFAGFAAAAWAGETRNHFRQAVRVLG